MPIQSPATIGKRRAVVAALTIGSTGVAVGAFASILGDGGWTATNAAIFALILLSLPWTMLGFWSALIGFILGRSRTGALAVAPYLNAAEGVTPLTVRTAILMTIRNEDPARALKRLKVMHFSLQKTGEAHGFDYFVLSDTSDPVVAAQEEKLFAAWAAEVGRNRVTYRRRTVNTGFKAGNVRDFLERWGGNYELMLPLDADSLMTGDAIVRLVRIMQAHPRIGILQTLIAGAPSLSPFGRIFQFGMRHGMRTYALGSAWWNADFGPYWGHNAAIRIKPFMAHCELPVLPGSPPFGGPVLSHDHIEGAMMRSVGGYEVRVMPLYGGSFEDNPPTMLDFMQRDLRWCQGVMQYWRLLGRPEWRPMSRFQIGMTSVLYLSSAGWFAALILAAMQAMAAGGTANPALVAGLVALWFISSAPKLLGILGTLITRGGTARYGGTGRFLTGSLVEILFSLILAPIAITRTIVFMIATLFRQSINWGGQNRDAYGISFATAASALWPQTLFGGVLFTGLYLYAPDAIAWAAPFLGGLLLAIPFAMLTASPRFGQWLASLKLCGTPEEFDTPPELAALQSTEIPDESIPVHAAAA